MSIVYMRKYVNNWILYFSKRRQKWQVSNREWHGDSVEKVLYEEFDKYEDAEKWAKNNVPTMRLIQKVCVLGPR